MYAKRALFFSSASCCDGDVFYNTEIFPFFTKYVLRFTYTCIRDYVCSERGKDEEIFICICVYTFYV